MARPKGSSSKSGYKINWWRVKAYYMSHPRESLNNVRRRFNIGESKNTLDHTRGWIQERNEMMDRVNRRLTDKSEDIIFQEYNDYLVIIDNVRYIIDQNIKKLKNAIERNFKINNYELLNMMTALEKAVKTKKLIRGEPTENIEQKSIHLELIKIAEEVKKHDSIVEVETLKDQEDTEIIQDQKQE